MDGEHVLPGRVVAPHEAPAVVTEYFDALNAEDWARLEPLWHPGADLTAPGSRPRQGREDIMAYFRPLFEPWASHRDEPTRCLVSESVVMVEVAFTGVSRSGKTLSFNAVDVFDLDDDTITRLTTWYDLNWLRKQI